MDNPFKRIDTRLARIETLIAELRDKPVPELPIINHEESLLTRKQVAQRYRVSLVTVQKWRKMGELPRPLIIGGRLYWKEKNLVDREEKNLTRK